MSPGRSARRRTSGGLSLTAASVAVWLKEDYDWYKVEFDKTERQVRECLFRLFEMI